MDVVRIFSFEWMSFRYDLPELKELFEITDITLLRMLLTPLPGEALDFVFTLDVRRQGKESLCFCIIPAHQFFRNAVVDHPHKSKFLERMPQF